MRVLLLISTAWLLVGANTVRRQRREDCNAVFQTYSNCVKKSSLQISSVKDDGSKDLLSRRACNVLTDLASCGDQLAGSCYTQRQIQILKHKQSGEMLRQFQDIPGWDGSKCPAVREYEFYKSLSGAPTLKPVSIPLVIFCIMNLFLLTQ